MHHLGETKHFETMGHGRDAREAGADKGQEAEGAPTQALKVGRADDDHRNSTEAANLHRHQLSVTFVHKGRGMLSSGSYLPFPSRYSAVSPRTRK